MNYQSRSADYSPITRVAFELLCKEFQLNKNDWSGPEITAEKGSYKLDWQHQNGGLITLYDDGVAQYYDEDEQKETQIIPLDGEQWIEILISRDVIAIIAVCAVEFFKDIKSSE